MFAINNLTNDIRSNESKVDALPDHTNAGVFIVGNFLDCDSAFDPLIPDMGFCIVFDEEFIPVGDISLDSTPCFLIWNGAYIESSD